MFWVYISNQIVIFHDIELILHEEFQCKWTLFQSYVYYSLWLHEYVYKWKSKHGEVWHAWRCMARLAMYGTHGDVWHAWLAYGGPNAWHVRKREFPYMFHAWRCMARMAGVWWAPANVWGMYGTPGWRMAGACQCMGHVWQMYGTNWSIYSQIF